MNIPRDVFYYDVLDYVPLEDISELSLIRNLAPRRSKDELLDFISMNTDPYLIDVYLHKYQKWELLERLILTNKLPSYLFIDPVLETLPSQVWIHTGNPTRTVDILEKMFKQDLLGEIALADLENKLGFEIGDPGLENLLGEDYGRYEDIIIEVFANFYPTFV